jgi:MbtH protein
MSDDADRSHCVLRNEEGQYSLWPSFSEVPAGWSLQYGPDEKAACLAYVEQNWTDMRPLSLVHQMDARRKEISQSAKGD